MNNKNDFERRLKDLEVGFHNKVSNLPLDNNFKISILSLNLFQKEVSKEVQVDTTKLSEEASRLMKNSEEITDTEVAIELLKYIRKNNKSRTIRNLASKMIKGKWWKKY